MLYPTLLQQVSRLSGRVRTAMPDSEADMCLGFIANEVTRAWEYAAWPELSKTEAVGVDVSTAETWADATTYAADDLVSYDGAYYKSLAGSNTGYEPSDYDAWWELISPFRTIARATACTAEIGQCPGIYTEDPATVSQPAHISYWEEGADLVLESEQYIVWVDYLEPAPLLLGMDVEELAALDVPNQLASAIAYRAAGHLLRGDGMAEMGNELIGMGEAELAQRLERVKWPKRWVSFATMR